jgi:hypothetical protein
MPFTFERFAVIPDPPAICLIPRWPSTQVVNTSQIQELVGLVFDGQGGAYVLTIEIDPGPLSNHTALQLTYITSAGVRGQTIDVHRSTNWPAGFTHRYSATAAPIANGRCAVAWGETGSVFRVEAFDSTGMRIFTSQLAPAANVPRLPALVPRGPGVVAAFFHFTANTRQLFVRFVDSSGTVTGGGLEWPAVTGFNDFNFPQIASDDTGDVVVLWLEPSTTFLVLAQRIGAGGQLVGGATQVATTGEAWGSVGIRRAVTDGASGCYFGTVDGTDQLSLIRLFQPRRRTFPFASWTQSVVRLVDRSAYAIAADGNGSALMSCISATGRLSAHRFDQQRNDDWIGMSAHDIAGLSIQLMTGASHAFFSHAVSIVPNRVGGAIVVYQDVIASASATEVTSTLVFTCIESNGRLVTRRGTLGGVNFPANMRSVSADEYAAVVAWRDHPSGSNVTAARAQKVGCCPDRSGTLITWPPRDFKGLPRGSAALPEHFPVVLPGRTEDGRFYGFMPLMDLAGIPGVRLPGGLVTPGMPRPDWVRISFSDLPRDFEFELFTQKSQSVARAQPVDSQDARGPAVAKELIFRPTHKGIYILGIGYQGADYAPGDRHLVRVSVEFGDDPRSKRRRRSSAARGRRTRRGRRKAR